MMVEWPSIKGLADLVVTVDNRTPEEVARFIKCM